MKHVSHSGRKPNQKPNQKLTRRQQQIYDYLLSMDDVHAPTIEEVCIALGLKSRGSMHKHITALIESGLVEAFDGKRRGIRLAKREIDETATAKKIPMLGKIAAGLPMEAITTDEGIVLPDYLDNGGNCYALVVKGDSMTDMGIDHGDWVVIEHTNDIKNGDIVVALIDGTDATLKRFEKSGNRVQLHPENALMTTQEYSVDQVEIQGKLVAHMRKFF